MSNKKYNKMWGRRDGSGNLVPGSNKWAPKKPKLGNWVEIQNDECCNPPTTTTTTTGGTPPCMTYQGYVSRGVALIIYTDCDGETQSVECYPGFTPFCALLGQYVVIGQAGVFEVGEGCITTTSTTTEEETTTTTTTLEV